MSLVSLFGWLNMYHALSLMSVADKRIQRFRNVLIIIISSASELPCSLLANNPLLSVVTDSYDPKLKQDVT